MNENNVVVVRGRVTHDPICRELASGAVVTQFDVAVAEDQGSATVPVAWFDPPTDRIPQIEQDVIVIGAVRRRFFRAGGSTQSRTEVVAERVVLASRRRDTGRALAAAAELLTRSGGTVS